MAYMHILIYLAIALLAALLFYFAFGEIPMPYVCGLFPYGKENLVRHYACSLALCTRGCDWLKQESNRICLDYDCNTKVCKKWCDDYCTNPPPSWPTDPAIRAEWNNAGAVCGKAYNISFPLEQKILWRGYYESFADLSYNPPAGWRTDVLDMIENFNKPPENFPTIEELLPGKFKPNPASAERPCVERRYCYGWDLLGNPTCWWNFGFGLINDKDGDEYGNKPSNGGDIVLDQNEAIEIYGCSKISVPTEPGISYLSYGIGFSSCLLKGNIHIWSNHEEVDGWEYTVPGCADVYFNSSTPSPATFDLEVTPSYQKIRLDDMATFAVKVTNHLGTGSDFGLSISYCSLDGGDCGSNLGCNLATGCTESFSPSSITAADENSGSSTLTLKPLKEGKYKIWVKADPSAAYGSETRYIDLTVTNFKVELSPSSREVKINDEGTFNVIITNQLDADANFDLEYIGDSSCTCSFGSNPLFVSNGSTGTTTLKCKSPNTGQYNIQVRATTDSFSKNSNPVILNVVLCFGDIALNVNPATVSSGQPVSLTVSGLTECDTVPIVFAVNHTALEIDSCTGDTGCSKSYTANSPGGYVIYAEIDLNGDNQYIGDTEIASAGFTINKPSLSDGGCNADGGCSFRMGERTCWNVVVPTSTSICDYCRCCLTNVFGACIGVCADDCGKAGVDGSVTYGLDPQSCRSTSPSNLCCISNSNVYSPGPSDVPCLSPDTYTNNDENDYISYSDVGNPRHVLVSDYQNATYSDPGMLNITISDSGRPVYGVQIRAKGRVTVCTWEFLGQCLAYGQVDCDPSKHTGPLFYVYLYKSDSKIELAYQVEACAYTTFNYRPSTFSWDDIKKIEITSHGSGSATNPNYLYVDYVGLLTKGEDIPYCTDGTGDYNRIVNDAKKCYWGVDCPSSGSGWSGTESTGFGPFKESNNACDCSSTTSCGSGYCRNGNFCVYDLKCLNGGWSGNLVYCPSQNCNYQGCS